MGEYLITFRSITYAQRGERVLGGRGMRVYLSRTPKSLSKLGCGYCVHLFTDNILSAVQALRAAEVPMRKVYRKASDGRPEELYL